MVVRMFKWAVSRRRQSVNADLLPMVSDDRAGPKVGGEGVGVGTFEAGFRNAVRGGTGDGGETEEGTDVDDRARAFDAEVGEEGAGHGDGAKEVGIELGEKARVTVCGRFRFQLGQLIIASTLKLPA